MFYTNASILEVLEKYQTLEIIKPESPLEEQLFEDPGFLQGLWWGFPRYGHPEGKIIFHIREVLDNIDRLTLTSTARQKLRLVALLHDSFKYAEYLHRKLKDPAFSHAQLAKNYAEKFISDEQTIRLIEWHDEAYFCWRMIYLFHQREAGMARLERFLQFIEKDIQLYYTFFACDTKTGDKNKAPLVWFEKNVQGIKKITL